MPGVEWGGMTYAPGPTKCRRSAYALFASQIEHLENPEALVTAATAISKHELETAEPAVVHAQLQEWADVLVSRVRDRNPQALLAHGHQLLFDELGFTGNSADYYNPFNSYLPLVLETRKGNPITLVLVYREVMRRAGLAVYGINSPGHFIAAVKDNEDGPLMYVDPFGGGRLMNDEEIYALIEQITGSAIPHSDQMLPLATPRQWLHRMLQNLANIFAREDRSDDVAAMNEMAMLLQR